MAVLSSLVVRLALESATFQSGLRSAQTELRTFSREAGQVARVGRDFSQVARSAEVLARSVGAVNPQLGDLATTALAARFAFQGLGSALAALASGRCSGAWRRRRGARTAGDRNSVPSGNRVLTRRPPTPSSAWGRARLSDGDELRPELGELPSELYRVLRLLLEGRAHGRDLLLGFLADRRGGGHLDAEEVPDGRAECVETRDRRNRRPCELVDHPAQDDPGADREADGRHPGRRVCGGADHPLLVQRPALRQVTSGDGATGTRENRRYPCGTACFGTRTLSPSCGRVNISSWRWPG